MKAPQSIDIDIPIYDCDLRVIFAEMKNNDWQEMVPEPLRGNAAEHFNDASVNPKFWQGLSLGYFPDYCILIFSGWLPVLHHESNHVARRILRDLGDKMVFDAEESLSYLESFIFAQTLKLYAKKYGKEFKSRTTEWVNEVIADATSRKRS